MSANLLRNLCITLHPQRVMLREVAASTRRLDCSDFTSRRAAMTGEVLQRFLKGSG